MFPEPEKHTRHKPPTGCLDVMPGQIISDTPGGDERIAWISDYAEEPGFRKNPFQTFDKQDIGQVFFADLKNFPVGMIRTGAHGLFYILVCLFNGRALLTGDVRKLITGSDFHIGMQCKKRA